MASIFGHLLPRSEGQMAEQAEVHAATPVSDVAWEEGRTLNSFPADELARQIQGRFDASYDESREERVRWWPLSDYFRDGEHWVYWNTHMFNGTGDWVPSLVPEETQVSVNLSVSGLRDASSRMVQRAPAYTAAAMNDDKESMDAAALSKQLLLHDWRELNIGQARWFATIDSLQYGMGIMKYGWDERAGTPRPVYKDMRDAAGEIVGIQTNAAGEPIVDRLEYDGGAFVRRVSPYNFFPCPGQDAPTLADAPWVIEAFYSTPGELKRAFDLPRSKKLDDSMSARGRYQLGPPRRRRRRDSTEGNDGRVLTLQYLQRPAEVPGFESGAVITVVGNEVIARERSQFYDGRYPYALLTGFPHLGSFWPVAWMRHLIQINKTYDEAESHALNSLRMAGSPNLLSRRGNALPQEIYMGHQLMEYDLEPPHWLPSPQVNPATFEVAQQSLNDFDRVGGQFPISRGQNTPGITSGFHAELLKDADDIDQLAIAREHAVSYQNLGTGLLDLHRRFDQPERVIRIIGEDKRTKFITFKKDLLPIGQQVAVEEESLLASLSSARGRFVMELANAGFFGPFNQDPKMQKQLLKAINVPQLTEIPVFNQNEDQTYDRVFDEIIDGRDPREVSIEAFWNLEILLEQLRARLFESDFRAWNHETQQRMRGFFQQVRQEHSKREQALADAAAQAQQKDIEAQARAKRLETDENIRERMSVEAMKAGSQDLVNQEQSARELENAEKLAAVQAETAPLEGSGAETAPEEF